MTLNEAIMKNASTLVKVWLGIMFLGVVVLPLTLFAWQSTFLLAIICLVAGGLGMWATQLLYNRLGYVRLLGLGHIVFWTPLAIYLWTWIGSDKLNETQHMLLIAILATHIISLVFDYIDAVRYALGDRVAMRRPEQG